MSRPILDELTRALFAHLRGGNSCFDEENELIGLFRQCPRCSRSLRPLVLDSFTDEKDGEQYERMWWTCPGIGQKQCFFPLDIPKEVFWTRRSMQQSLRGIFPLPNLHLLPRSLRVLYPKLFNRNINIEEIVRLSAFAPSDGQRKAERHANSGAEEQQQQQLSTHGGAQVGQSAGPSLLITLPPFPSSSQSPDFCDGFSSSPRDVERQQIERQQTVHSFLKETLNNRLPWRSQSSSIQRGEHRKTVDLSPNANAALKSHLLLNDKCDPKLMINSLNSLDPTARKQTSVPRYLSQQQHIRLKGMLRRSIAPNPKESGRKKSKGEVAQYNGPRYLFARTMPQEEETKKKGQRQKVTAERSKTEKKTDGKGQRSDGMDVFTALDTLQKSLIAKEFSRFYGPQGSPSAIPSKQTTVNQPTKSDRTTDSNELFHASDSFLPQSLTVEPHSTVTPLTNSANSSESNGSSLGRFRRGLSIGPAVPGVSDNVGDPSLAEKITRNYESIFLKTLQQMNTNRRPVTPSSAFSTVQPHLPVSPQFGQIVPDEAVFPEESTLGGIPHDFHFSSAPQPVPLLPPAVRQSNQLVPINYAEGEDLSKRFAHKQMEVTEINQQEQMPSFSLGEMPDYDTYLGFGLEEEGDPAALEMTPMMPAGQVEDEGDFLRTQMGMLP